MIRASTEPSRPWKLTWNRDLKRAVSGGSSANLLAERGETDKLLPQIGLLKKVGFAPLGVQYLAAHYYVNSNRFQEARRTPHPTRPDAQSTPYVQGEGQ